jgi:ABC-type bacteriocin/lantibiotic exporter with double-glycine peptidase domain
MVGAAGQTAVSDSKQPDDKLSTAGANDSKVWRVPNKCSVNALFVVLRLRGQEVSYERVEEVVAVSQAGTSMIELVKSSRQLGLNAQVVRATPRSLRSCSLPVIAHYEEEVGTSGHYVVVTATTTDEIQVIDGTTAALRNMPIADFQTRWSGHLIVFETDPWWQLLFPAVALLGVITVCLAVWCQYRRRSNSDLGTAQDPQTMVNEGSKA